MSDIHSAAKQKMGSTIGWNFTQGSPEWHWFTYGQSICGEWRESGLTNCDDDPATDDSPDNCSVCRDHVELLRKKEIENVTT